MKTQNTPFFRMLLCIFQVIVFSRFYPIELPKLVVVVVGGNSFKGSDFVLEGSFTHSLLLKDLSSLTRVRTGDEVITNDKRIILRSILF